MEIGKGWHILRYWRMVFLFLVFAVVSTPADQPDSSKTRQKEIQITRLIYVGVGTVGINWAGFRYLERNWWQGKKVPFRLVHDWSGDTNLNLDHGGHFMSGIFFAQITGDFFRWIGFSPRTAVLLGSLSSLAELLYIEYRDGRYDQWGFSVPDATADVLGALIPFIHENIPATQTVRFKYGYFPSPLYRDRNLRRVSGRPYVPSFVDDYEGMTFWIVVNPRPLLPKHADQIWPDWLGVAVGMGAKGLHGYGQNSRGSDRGYSDLPDAQREIYLSPDFDFVHLLSNYEIFRRFTPYFRLRRFPAPALRIYPTLAVHLVNF